MTYQPQVILTCSTCLKEKKEGVRTKDNVFRVIVSSVLDGFPFAEQHFVDETTHGEFSVELKSTGERIEFDLSKSLSDIEGMMPGIERFN